MLGCKVPLISTFLSTSMSHNITLQSNYDRLQVQKFANYSEQKQNTLQLIEMEKQSFPSTILL